MKKYLNQKGFTLIEILVVISIIAILFVLLLPQVNNAFQRSKISGVKNDFRSFQLAGDSYMREINGNNPTVNAYNVYLDHAIRFVGDESKKTDPWGKPYKLQINEGKIVIQSSGLDETMNNSDDYYLAIYHAKGIADVCTSGFENNNIELTDVTLAVGGKCGDSPL